MSSELTANIIYLVIPVVITTIAGALWVLFREVLLGVIHKPVYTKLETIEDILVNKLDSQHRIISYELQALRTNGHAFADRVSNIEERQTDAIRDISRLRSEVHNLEVKEK